MSEAKFSLIIPVYNGKKYLKECLDSVLNQTFSDFEAICIDDGSKDNSLAILKEYEKDLRFKIFSKENQGVSIARNFGIKKAKGEYLIFLDSDDFLEKNALEKLYNETENKNSDILLFSFFRYQNGVSIEDFRLKEAVKKTDLDFNNDYNELILVPQTACGKIYKTSLIKENSILFPENITCGEDRYFAMSAYFKAKKISVLNEPLYYYRINSSDSLSKQGLNSLIDTYNVNNLIKTLIYSSILENKDEIYKKYLDNTIDNILNHWNGIYNFKYKKYTFKYLKLLKKEYIKNNFQTDKYQELNKEIKKYQNLFFSKLFEPVFEIVYRRERINIYLFENLIFNLSTKKISDFIFKLRYFRHLLKLKIASKYRKIKVALYISEIEKYCAQAFIEELKKSELFEPVIFISAFKNNKKDCKISEIIKRNLEYFKNKNIKYELLYDIEKEEFIDIKKFKADIIFYQQPWQIPVCQNIVEASKIALVCYFPYCFYSMISDFNYFSGFHGKMWKYFVETPFHKEEYEKEFNAKNCIALGSIKLDNYEIINKEKYQKDDNKKRIIYAPHHSFDSDTGHNCATFLENGDFILNLAKNHPETKWIIRPHPEFYDRLLKTNKKTKTQIDEYFLEWEKIGTISKPTDNYFEQFILSDCLITDSISFLAEYLPLDKPLLHLRNKNQKEKFNSLIEKIISSYYQIYSNNELEEIFNNVVLLNNDYLKDKRKENIKLLMIDNKTASYKIMQYLKKEINGF